MSRRLLVVSALFASLAGCDQLGIESATVTAARVEADGKAVGAACRYSGRAIEDCFALNKKIDKAAIYAGWREMDDYMRENKIAAVPPTITPLGHGASSGGETEAADADAPASAGDGGSKAATGKPGVAAADTERHGHADKPGKAASAAAKS